MTLHGSAGEADPRGGQMGFYPAGPLSWAGFCRSRESDAAQAPHRHRCSSHVRAGCRCLHKQEFYFCSMTFMVFKIRSFLGTQHCSVFFRGSPSADPGLGTLNKVILVTRASAFASQPQKNNLYQKDQAWPSSPSQILHPGVI